MLENGLGLGIIVGVISFILGWISALLYDKYAPVEPEEQEVPDGDIYQATVTNGINKDDHGTIK